MREWFSEIRKKNNMPQCDLAKATGVSQQLICMIESGERRPSVETAQRISKALNFDKHGLDWTAFFEKRTPPQSQSQSAVGE